MFLLYQLLALIVVQYHCFCYTIDTTLMMTHQASFNRGRRGQGRDLGVMFIETSAKAGFNIKVDIEFFVSHMVLFEP